MEGSDELTRDECWDRLRSRSVGHLAFTTRAMPMIRPVPYVVTGLHLLLTPSDELAAQVDGQVVAFEIDALDGDGHCGWSVVALGTARFVQEPRGVDSHRRVLLTVGELSGRRVLPSRPVPAA